MKKEMERPILRKAMMLIVVLTLVCSVIAQADGIGNKRGLKAEPVFESEYLELEQANLRSKLMYNYVSPIGSQPNSLPAGTANFKTVTNFADFEISDIQKATADGQTTAESYSSASSVVPESYYLTANYVNFSKPETLIKFHLPNTTRIELSVYNLLGQRVSILVEGVVSSGEHTFGWDSRDAHGHGQPSGIYFYRIDSELRSLRREMVLIK